MKKYLAIGTHGKNIKFRTQSEIIGYFELSSSKELNTIIQRNKPVEDPDTMEIYYLDELEDGADND